MLPAPAIHVPFRRRAQARRCVADFDVTLAGVMPQLQRLNGVPCGGSPPRLTPLAPAAPAAPTPRRAALSSANSSFDWELQSLASALPSGREDHLPLD